MVNAWNGWDFVVENFGKFSVKLVYKVLLGEHAKVGWRHLLIGNLATPKAKFIIWLAIQNRFKYCC